VTQRTPQGMGGPPNDVALLLPSRIPEDAPKLKEDAPKACTDCSKRWLERDLRGHRLIGLLSQPATCLHIHSREERTTDHEEDD